MDLWIVNHYAGGPTYGMGFRHFYLSCHLKKFTIKPTIISASFTHLYRESVDVAGHFLITEEEQVPRIYIKTRQYSGNNFRRLLNIQEFSHRVKKLAKARELTPPDIILGSSPPLSGALAALYLAQRWGIPFYFEVRDLWPLSLVDTRLVSRFHPLVWHMYHQERKLVRAAHRLISVLPLSEKYFVQRGLDPQKFFFLPNGTEPPHSKLRHPTAAVVDELKARRQDGEFAVVYAGNHGLANGLDTLIKAATVLRQGGREDIHIYLVGSGPEKLRLQSDAGQRSLTNVHFVDKVSREQVMAILGQAGACFIGLKKSPAFQYGVCPNKLLEYMLAGRPIIYAINSGNHPVLEAECGIEIAPESPNELAAAMISIADKTEAERAAIGERGRVYVMKHHRYETLAARLAELIRSDLQSSL